MSASQPAVKRQKIGSPAGEPSSSPSGATAGYLTSDTSPTDEPLALSLAQSPPDSSATATATASPIAAASNGNDDTAAAYISTWPSDDIPNEVFSLIASYLSRKDIQNLRLVNHEFDHHLTTLYFRTVVVPFRPDFAALYGSLDSNLDATLDSQQDGVAAGHSEGDVTQISGRAQNHAASHTSSSNKATELPAPRKSVMADGFRIFQQFGPKTIKKFALALELNELDLAYPPIKLVQEIVKAPWGLYRWPIKRYPRYSKLEGLENLADETQFMKEAFRWLTSITEVGISCDAGLGLLRGPDINRHCQPTSPAVFKPIDYYQKDDRRRPSSEEIDGRSISVVVLKQMALNAGWDENDWHLGVFRLLEDEGRNVQWYEAIDTNGNKFPAAVPRYLVDRHTPKQQVINYIEAMIAPPLPFLTQNGSVDSGAATEPRDGGGSPEAPSAVPGDQPTTRRRNNAMPLNVTAYPTSSKASGLIPGNLSAPQAEMLLELGWVHRALMQSYVIALMDTVDAFENLTTLTIARISVSHFEFLLKDEFWDAMDAIEHFSIGVIPEWRSIKKTNTGEIEERRVNPLTALDPVLSLLHNYVGKHDNITSLHFEWICGGELAMGISQRDRYILPAPVIEDFKETLFPVPSPLVSLEDWSQKMISLPHVEHLSLKNCWFPPHVFIHMVQKLSEQSLTHLELETVSLSGCPSSISAASIMPGGVLNHRAHWPWPLCCGAEPNHYFILNPPGQGNQPPVPAPAPPFPWMNNNITIVPNGGGPMPPQPVNSTTGFAGFGPAPVLTSCRWRAFSWPHVLAVLSMKPDALTDYYSDCTFNMQEHYGKVKKSERTFLPAANRKTKNGLKSIKFKSCGYALIDHPAVDNWDMIPNEILPVDHTKALIDKLKELDQTMLATQEPLLAKTLNYVSEEEEHIMRSLYYLDYGWKGVYEDVLITIAQADGNPDPGYGRFSGEVVKDKTEESSGNDLPSSSSSSSSSHA